MAGNMRKKTVMTYKAERVVKYRYKCENCAKTTDWQESKAWMTADNSKKSSHRRLEFNVERSPKELEKTSKESLSRLEKLTEVLDKVLKKNGERFIPDDPFIAEKYNVIFSVGAECPECKIRQSWYPAFAFKPNKWKSARSYVIGALILSGIISVITFSIWETSNTANSSSVAYLFLISCAFSTISGLIGYLRAKHLIKQYAPPLAESFTPFEPEVIWEKPTVELVDCPIEA